MKGQCILKEDSAPPVCAIHNAPLEEHSTAEISATSRYGEFTFLTCPISGQVIDAQQDRK
jgi:hypothetical protein